MASLKGAELLDGDVGGDLGLSLQLSVSLRWNDPDEVRRYWLVEQDHFLGYVHSNLLVDVEEVSQDWN